MRRRFAMLLHNVVAHPVVGVLRFFGLDRLGEAVHDATLPATTRQEGAAARAWKFVREVATTPLQDGGTNGGGS